MNQERPTPLPFAAGDGFASYLDGRLLVQIGDLTQVPADAIVNAANASLLGGGGVDGAIHRAGGPAILQACEALRRTAWPDGLPTGEAVLTTAGALPARYVVHTVGPIWPQQPGDPEQLLRAAYRSSLQVADDAGCVTAAFPAISTGVYGYPRERASEEASAAIADFLPGARHLRQVVLVFFNEDDAARFVAATPLARTATSTSAGQ